MRLLSTRNRVLWVNSIGLRKPRLGGRDVKRVFGKLKSFAAGLEKIHDNLYVFTPVVIPFHRARIVRLINAEILKTFLAYYTKKLGLRNTVFWSYLPNVGYIFRRLKAQVIVYHCVDEWSKFSFIDDNIVEEEWDLCRMADLVIASARSLYESRKPHNNNTHYISHGVDYRFFHNARLKDLPIPEDMTTISRPIAGFFGLIHEWIDLDLLEFVIKDNPGINFVFIGQCSVDVNRLATHKNAYFLGQKKYGDLLAYARHFDVGLIPFKVNDLTINVNPIKLKEYLALGIPVVSVDLPETGFYRNVVRIAGDYDAFSHALRDEVSGKHVASAEEIDLVARNETWDQKVEEISALFEATDKHWASSEKHLSPKHC